MSKAERRRQREKDLDLVSSSESDVEFVTETAGASPELGFTLEGPEGAAALAEAAAVADL